MTSDASHHRATAIVDQARELSGSQLTSALLAVAAERAAARMPAELLHQYSTDRFVLPGNVDPRVQLEIDRVLFAAASSFEALELGPLAPLGTCSVVAPTSQHRVVTTMRGSEVISDPTNVLALESACRLRSDPHVTVRLATSHRCVRAQPVPRGSGFSAHFRMFCLTSAAHQTKDQVFTSDALVEHIRTHVSALQMLGEIGYRIPPLRITLLSTAAQRHLADRIAATLSELQCAQEPLTKPYYDGLRFMISVEGAANAIPLIDGGAFSWVGQLAANRKLAFVASAIGSQLIAHLFRA